MAIKELNEFKASGEDSAVMDPVTKGSNSRAKDNNSVRQGAAEKVKAVTPGEGGKTDDMIDDKPKAKNNKRKADNASSGEKMSKLKEMVSVLSKMDPADLEELHAEMVSEGQEETSVIEVVREDFEALFSEDDLSEEFKTKFFTLVEAAVITKVLEETSTIQEAYDAKIEEATKEIEVGLTEKVDNYLNTISEKWSEDNKVEIESNIRLDIAESFMKGLKDLYESHYITVSDDEVNVVEELDEEVEALKEALNEAINDNIELSNFVEGIQTGEIIAEMSNELTESQKDKFTEIAENIEHSSNEEFIEKLEVIKESLTGVKSKTSDSSEQDLNEEFVSEEGEKPAVDDRMAAYIQAARDGYNQT